MNDPQVKKSDAVTWARWPELQDGDDVAKAATPVRLRRLILDAIQTGELRPGARLKETELVAALAVSRTPLREALAALQRLVSADSAAALRIAIDDATPHAGAIDALEEELSALGASPRSA